MTLSEFGENTRYAKDIISLGTSGCVMQLTNSLVSICCNNVLSGDDEIEIEILDVYKRQIQLIIYVIGRHIPDIGLFHAHHALILTQLPCKLAISYGL